MAIYQISFHLIPVNSVVERFGDIPVKVPPGPKDNWWHSSDITPSTIVSFLDSHLKRADWGNSEFSHNWKTYTNEVDNDAYLSIHEETGKIEELNFRADLREKDLSFLRNMLAFAGEYNLLLKDGKENLSLPNKEGVERLILESNAYRFLSDPKKFLQEAADRANEIEKNDESMGNH